MKIKLNIAITWIQITNKDLQSGKSCYSAFKINTRSKITNLNVYFMSIWSCFYITCCKFRKERFRVCLVQRPRCDLCTVLSTAIVRVIFCSVRNPSIVGRTSLWCWSGSNNSNKRGGGICCSNFFVAPNVTKLRMTYCIFEQVKKIFLANSLRIIALFYPKNCN